MAKAKIKLNHERHYSRDAYEFVSKAIKLAINRLDTSRHLSAYEVLQACRELALAEYAFLANEVLQSWGIHQPSDIGEIVFQMISHGILSASENDKLSDFDVSFELFKSDEVKGVNAKKVHDPIILD